jgi:dihydrofolate reductase
MKASVFIATSLDGFIARTNGDIDWLGEPQEGGEDQGYQKFIDTVDFLVMGRNTYEKVLSFGMPWPYEKPVVVLTHRPLDIAAELASSVESMSGSPADIVAKLSVRGAQHLYVDGGRTIQSFLDASLIQRLIITRIPVLLGAGIPLFGPLQQDIKLRHIETRAFEDGNLQSEYEVIG